MFVSTNNQSDFSELTSFADLAFDPNHSLLKLAAAIDWDALTTSLQKFYSTNRGRPTTPLRAQAGTLMLKYLKNLSDRAIVQYVHENIYAQRFCGLHPSEVVNYMDHATGLTQFRAKIGQEGMEAIRAALTSAARTSSKTKSTTLIVDTTCVPADILYPTDIRLLERSRLNILKLLKKAKTYGITKFYRTWSRTARKIFVTFSKLGKPNQKTRRRVHKKLFQFVRRNLTQLSDMRRLLTALRGRDAREGTALRKFLKLLKETETRVRSILHQQRLVRTGVVSIPERIVSFHKDHIRPIVRGKFPLSTEFGHKTLVAIAKGTFHSIESFQHNLADATLVTPALRWYKHVFGTLPTRLLGDRGFFSRWRVRLLKTIGITPGLQTRGAHVSLSPADIRMIHQRQRIEAAISLAKRKFGWSKCWARTATHETSWIALGAAALGAHKTFVLAKPP